MIREIERCAEVYRRWWETVASRVPIGIAVSLARVASIAASIINTGICEPPQKLHRLFYLLRASLHNNKCLIVPSFALTTRPQELNSKMYLREIENYRSSWI